MKVLYDHQTFTIQQYGGISRYFYELITRTSIDFESNLSCQLSNNYYLNNSNKKLTTPFFKNLDFVGKTKIIKMVNQKYSLSKIKKHNFDLFHPTYYSTYFLENLAENPFIVTFYDMIHEKFSNEFKELKLDKKIFSNKRLLIKKAKRIIAISEQTKKDIIEIFNITGDNIDVVYLGNSLLNIDFNRTRLVEQDYILFVGNRGLYKNFIKFINSIRDLLIIYDLHLVCAGGGRFTEEENRLLNSLEIRDRVFFKKIENDYDLANYYTNALFFSFPSLYEGFGIPILEAFASRTPLLASNSGSLPEIAAEAADYFNPSDENSIYKATEKLLIDSNRRNELIELGTKRLTKFSWDKTFTETLNVYQKALNI